MKRILGILTLLTLAGCQSNSTVDGQPRQTYAGRVVVKKIVLISADVAQCFEIKGLTLQKTPISFETMELNCQIGDTIYVDSEAKRFYPCQDSENISKIK